MIGTALVKPPLPGFIEAAQSLCASFPKPLSASALGFGHGCGGRSHSAWREMVVGDQGAFMKGKNALPQPCPAVHSLPTHQRVSA